jgi:hypothetical protein
MSVFKGLLLFGIFFGLIFAGCSTVSITSKVETIDSVKAWASPYWGYNAPKIIRNDKGEIWTVSFMGKYGDEKAQILKRDISGKWQKGKMFDHLYQPSMLFLDNEGKLNYIQNSQHDSISHYRSMDIENLNNFQLIAKGNGVDDGRGWYTGVGIHGSTMYLSYVTLQYDLFLTWKQVTDTSWHKAILLAPGLVDTVSGNHSWLYPRFSFHNDKGYITVSSTIDGSKYNTYDKVRLVTFSLSNPTEFTSEIVFNGTVGYSSYSYDAIITKNDKIVCGFNANKYKYGEKKNNITPEGIYVSVKNISSNVWDTYQVDDQSGSIWLYEGSKGAIYALVIRGSWDVETNFLIKKSIDNGKTWKIIENNVMKDHPELKHTFFGQVVHSHSGSTIGKGIDGIVTNNNEIKPIDGTYSFEMLYFHVDISE